MNIELKTISKLEIYQINLKGIHMNQEKTLQFMQIAMKYLPEAKEQLDKSGVELSMDVIQPFMNLFSKVMEEAYNLDLRMDKKN